MEVVLLFRYTSALTRSRRHDILIRDLKRSIL